MTHTICRSQCQIRRRGGFAGVLHGARAPNLDLDVVPAWTESNLERLVKALRAVNAASRSGPSTTSESITVALLVEREITNWNTDIGPIDVLVGIPNGEGLPVTFDALRENAQTTAQVAGCAALVAMKLGAVQQRRGNSLRRRAGPSDRSGLLNTSQ